MTRHATGLVAAALAAALGLSPASALAQTPPPKTPPPQSPTPPPQSPAPPATPPATPAQPQQPGPKPPTPAAKTPAKKKPPREARFRLVLDFAVAPQTLNYEDLRTPTAFAETSQIATSYEAGIGLGAGVALQASFYRGLGVLVGYSYVKRDVTGIVDVSRPHPLHLNRPRDAAPAEISGAGYSEGVFDVDAAYVHAGRVEWAIFGGVSFFNVEADLLDVPTFNEIYPYDELTVGSAPTVAVSESATGWNVGGRLDYRFGKSKHFGVGVTLKYSAASVELVGTQVSTPAKVDAGGLRVGGGVRFYF
jgi:hypothetical protein